MLDLLPDLFDEHADQLNLIALAWQNYGGKAIFWGEIDTIRCYRDNSKVKQRLAQPGKGKVLVVDGGGDLSQALLGDMIAASAVANGWEGIIINGAVRDVGTIATLPLGVKALGTVPIKTEKRDLGEISVTIELANVKLKPGMMIYADANGVAVSTHPLAIPSSS
ncbi:putative 4-hydroxy-4-methyl-2-oxoglutarate aldolase [Shewanella avicenniae]|uniref:4-hydroxy-4-methyl-2-oxoglutarate aldolase n=1 Tax=Shewanella avicenniae TaxID=2814294 RepID=A0ABX7QV48_9GAMM|nr:putative 4-hydroxy-4-methyl-2-oxoglutarate aldolase [Shewanella avicenniae]QSX35304.1 putative 4-hydroxy-4-methyl-2-oxoglutarate aldolase [Shewanella avicenniae]